MENQLIKSSHMSSLKVTTTHIKNDTCPSHTTASNEESHMATLEEKTHMVSRPKPDTRICNHDWHANIKLRPDINKNQLNF